MIFFFFFFLSVTMWSENGLTECCESSWWTVKTGPGRGVGNPSCWFWETWRAADVVSPRESYEQWIRGWGFFAQDHQEVPAGKGQFFRSGGHSSGRASRQVKSKEAEIRRGTRDSCPTHMQPLMMRWSVVSDEAILVDRIKKKKRKNGTWEWFE